MANWDAIVIGLGGVGSAATYHLAAEGHRVLGIDRFPPPHDQGSSHGKTRIIRQAYFEHSAYVPLLRRAYQLWDELQQRANCQLFHRTGLVEVGPHDGIVIPGVLRSAAEHGLSIEQMSAGEMTRRWPGFVCPEDWQAIFEQDAGFLKVEDCVRWHLRLAIEAGATCLYGVAAQQWQIDGSGWSVVTDQGIERAERLVFAGGPWSGAMLADLGLELQVLRKHQYWYQPDKSGFELQDRIPCFFHETPVGFFYGFPSIDGSGVKVARHSGGQPLDEPDAPHAPDEADRKLVESYIETYLTGVGKTLTEQAGCYYTMTPDEHFIFDTHPQHPEVVVIAGLSGHGFKFTSVLGEIASQLATSQRSQLDIDLFRIDRRGMTNIQHRMTNNQ